MGYELLKALTQLLRGAGISAGESHPGVEAPRVDAPMAAVGLLGLDIPAGLAKYQVRVLSPRMQGGWYCQIWAARVTQILCEAGLTCTAEEMEYLDGCDCFCVEIRAEQSVVPMNGGWVARGPMQVLCGELEQTGVESFTAVREQGRRIQGATGQWEPLAITPGRDGWRVELIQWVDRSPEPVGEPFVLTVREGDRECRYTGCGWNEERYEHTARGLRLIRRGFALAREEENHG